MREVLRYQLVPDQPVVTDDLKSTVGDTFVAAPLLNHSARFNRLRKSHITLFERTRY